MNKTDTKPLFTLTAEEVEIFQQLLISTKKEFYKLKPTFEVAEKIVQTDSLLTRINKWKQMETKVYQVTLYELTYEDDYHGHDTVSKRKIYSREVEAPEETANMLKDLFHHINVCNRIVELDIQETL